MLYQLTLAHDIAAVAPTCRLLCDAAKLALKLRPFSGEVVALAGHEGRVCCVAVVPDGRIITGAYDRTVKVWRDGACERTIQAHTKTVNAVAVLPGGARFVSGSDDCTAKLWTLDGALERTFAMGSNWVWSVAALPDGVHFVVGLGNGPNQGDVKLYHVDGTLVHTFKGRTDWVGALAVTPDGQHIISGSWDARQGVERRHQEPREHLRRAHRWVHAVAAMPDGQRFLSGGTDGTVRVWLLDGTLKNTFGAARRAAHQPRTRPRGAARQPARALRLGRQDRQALQRQRRRRAAHLQAPHKRSPL